MAQQVVISFNANANFSDLIGEIKRANAEIGVLQNQLQGLGSSSFGSLIAPIKRLAGMNIPIPYAPQLEKAAVPQIDDIEAAAREIVKNWR